MSSTIKKKKQMPIAWRVTMWYTIFIAIILIVLFALALFIYRFHSTSTVEKTLVENVNHAAHDIITYENWDDYDFFSDGIYYSIYRFDGVPMKGEVFEDFEITQPLSFDDPSRYKDYIYYDTLIPNEEYYIRGVMDISSLEDQSQSMLYTFLIAIPVILVVAAAGGYRIMKSAFSLVEDVTDTAIEIQEKNDLSKRIEVGDGDDEITRMAQAFNGMLDTIQKLYERERQMSQDVSHELRTPVSVILAESQYALTYATTLNESKDSLRTIERQSQKMKELINQVMELARLDGSHGIEKEWIDFSRLVSDSAEDLKKLADDKEVICEIEQGIHLQGNLVLLSRLIDNLFSNANKFADKRIVVRLYADATEAVFEVSDDGPGISSEDRKKIFDRFYQAEPSRNKKKARGYGLGLSFVRAIADQHDGQLEAESLPSIGSNFRVRLPLADDVMLRNA